MPSGGWSPSLAQEAQGDERDEETREELGRGAEPCEGPGPAVPPLAVRHDRGDEQQHGGQVPVVERVEPQRRGCGPPRPPLRAHPRPAQQEQHADGLGGSEHGVHVEELLNVCRTRQQVRDPRGQPCLDGEHDRVLERRIAPRSRSVGEPSPEPQRGEVGVAVAVELLTPVPRPADQAAALGPPAQRDQRERAEQEGGLRRAPPHRLTLVEQRDGAEDVPTVEPRDVLEAARLRGSGVGCAPRGTAGAQPAHARSPARARVGYARDRWRHDYRAGAR